MARIRPERDHVRDLACLVGDEAHPEPLGDVDGLVAGAVKLALVAETGTGFPKPKSVRMCCWIDCSCAAPGSSKRAAPAVPANSTAAAAADPSAVPHEFHVPCMIPILHRCRLV
jgi:hypothetical protein